VGKGGPEGKRRGRTALADNSCSGGRGVLVLGRTSVAMCVRGSTHQGKKDRRARDGAEG
jgi:hypothetical protein